MARSLTCALVLGGALGFVPGAPRARQVGPGSLAGQAVGPAVERAARRTLVRVRASAGEAKKQVGVGVIGCGRIGLTHLEALAECPECKVHIVSNPTVSKAEAAAKQWGVPRFCADAVDVINDPDTEAIWICSPSSTHADLICRAAEAGKHVFCEKPLAMDLPETIKAIQTCKDNGVKLMTALQRRFDPHFNRVKHAVETGEVGEPIMVKLCSRDPAPPPIEYVRGGGGVFKDQCVHDLDMARYLMGCEPQEILALGTNHVDKSLLGLDEDAERYDTSAILIRFQNDKTAIIDTCRQAPYGHDQRAEVLGTKGMIMTENVYPSTARVYLKDFTGNADMPYDFFMSRYKEAYVTETKAFVQALWNDEPAPCTGEDGLVALIMAIAAGRSAKEKRWVRFSEIPEMVECVGGECIISDDTGPPREFSEEETLEWADKAKKLIN